LGKSFGRTIGGADLEEHRFPLDVAKFLQPLPECGDKGRKGHLSGRGEKPDLRHPRCLLTIERECDARRDENTTERPAETSPRRRTDSLIPCHPLP